MSWHFSQALVEVFSDQGFLDGKRCALLRSTRTVERSLSSARKTESSSRSQSGMMFAPSEEAIGKAVSMWSRQDSLANRSPSPGNEKEVETSGISGLKPSESFGKWDPDGACWRTCPDSSLADPATTGSDTSAEYSETWPKAGSLRNGECSRRPTWERPISERGSGLLPTPTDSSKGGGSSRSGKRKGETPTLQGMARKGLFPTPSVASAKQGQNEPDGKRGQTLVGAVRGQQWPTPKSSPSGPDYARANRPGSGGDDLATAVARFPTPYGMSSNQGQQGGEFQKAVAPGGAPHGLASGLDEP